MSTVKNSAPKTAHRSRAPNKRGPGRPRKLPPPTLEIAFADAAEAASALAIVMRERGELEARYRATLADFEVKRRTFERCNAEIK